jgi:hypothetical protein
MIVVTGGLDTLDDTNTFKNYHETLLIQIPKLNKETYL